MRVRLFVLLAFLATSLFAQQQQQTPRNVILIIGDGMGTAHVTAMRHHRAADFQLGRMNVMGLQTTTSADRYVTDSAAAASSLATGVKVNYEAVSVDPKSGAPLPTVLEAAEKAGKASGIVTTAQFFDATPAAFAAHVPHRRQGTAFVDIVNQMLGSGADVIIGTGANELAKTGMPSLAELATKHGYSFATTRAQLDAAAGAKLLAVFPEQTRDLDVPDAPLPALARTALARLRGHAKGFFLMIEHEGIDSSSHQNNVPDLIASLKSFDETVGVALDFAAANPGTLVLVTGDHETGSLRISETRSGRIRLEWATIEHTATAIPVFAFGPGANAFGGVYDNTDIGKRLIEIVGR